MTNNLFEQYNVTALSTESLEETNGGRLTNEDYAFLIGVCCAFLL